ncbi:MAG: hypothetical protein HY842_06905 [Bacteroidetes bacterium]|nr:hypothetical protein [Bacteroidota bacterium]
MKISHLVFLLGLALFAACKDDDSSTLADLRYDGENFTGPLLDAGEHELAVRFPASKMADYAGKKLTEVQVYVGPVLPQTCLIRVYGEGNDSIPGPKLYDGNVTSTLVGDGWNTFQLTPATDLTGDDLWIGVFVEHAVQQQSIGCDAGPRKENGDWLFKGEDLLWKTYIERTNESVNWNIRGVVE